MKNSNIKIFNDKFTVSIDNYHRVCIEDKNGGFLEEQSVEAILLTEIIRLLQKRNNGL